MKEREARISWIGAVIFSDEIPTSHVYEMDYHRPWCSLSVTFSDLIVVDRLHRPRR